jgi:hypothetical protein
MAKKVLSAESCDANYKALKTKDKKWLRRAYKVVRQHSKRPSAPKELLNACKKTYYKKKLPGHKNKFTMVRRTREFGRKYRRPAPRLTTKNSNKN